MLVVPKVSLWWNEEFNALQPFIRHRFQEIASTEACDLYDLRRRPVEFEQESTNGRGPSAVSENAAALELIAFYLPQFHPIPENDAWWGEGFTEWRNVVNARPLFDGHYQPRLPSNLGFYDLRLPETREAQAELARAHGITGFCYYHYWFSGKQLLRASVRGGARRAAGRTSPSASAGRTSRGRDDGTDRSRTSSSRRSTARKTTVSTSPGSSRHLLDERAIRVDGKPLFLVYQGRELPDPARTVEIWQARGARGRTSWDPSGVRRDRLGRGLGREPGRLRRQGALPAAVLDPRPATAARGRTGDRPRLSTTSRHGARSPTRRPLRYHRYECVCPSWDNTARRGEDSWVLHNSTPEAYQEWLELAIRRTLERPGSDRLVFLNAWNEWAEGAHLEPDQRHGLAYLEATKRALGARVLPIVPS